MDSGGNNYRRGGGAGGRRGRGRGAGGGRGWDAPQRQFHDRPPAQQDWVPRPTVQGYTGANRPPSLHTPPSHRPPYQGVVPSGGRGVAWTVRSSSQSQTSSSAPTQTLHAPPPYSSSDYLDIQQLKISTKQSSSSSSQSKENQIQPIRRPDQGGVVAVRSIKLLVNHFPVKFDPNKTILHYYLDVKPVTSDNNTAVRTPSRKSELRLIREKFIPDDLLKKTAYDGEKNIFSAVHLDVGQFTLDVSNGEDVSRGSYTITIKLVNELKLSKLEEYLRGELSYIPRDILQGMDLILKENPSRMRISVGRSFYPPHKDIDLCGGVTASHGFQQGLKPTSQGLALCLDYSILSFHKPIHVTDYLKELFPQIKSVPDIIRCHRREAIGALKGLKVRVTHRRCKQKYTISGLAEEDTCDSYFDIVDPEGNSSPRKTSLVSYFGEKWKMCIEYINIPCLELGKNNKSNKVPMEFCILVEGQRYPKENLDKESARNLKRLTLAEPGKRKDKISLLLQAHDGPCGELTKFFNIEVDDNMTKVVGRVIGAPDLKLGGSDSVKVTHEKCQWNLVGRRSLVDGVAVERWALLDFTKGERFNKLHTDTFINSLRGRSKNLGMSVEEPLLRRASFMIELSDANRLEKLLQNVVVEASAIGKGSLQLIVCVMAKRDPGYKFLKWVTETQIGVVTQCCLSSNFNKGNDQELANLCLKINAKLGGSNFELMGKLPHFDAEDRVMFIGADVNHPATMDSSCPSIAAVVGTVNWPAVNRYAARVSPQIHRQEKISKFGDICRDLVDSYALHNNVKPTKLVVFRDGVSEGQFGMVLAEELFDLKKAIYDDEYKPSITLIVAQKRHQTRLFPVNASGGVSGNVPPGTVVDSKIVHPFDFDFYLCSHYGSMGTSKPTHYYVLWDENGFTSDDLQKLIYGMCFTFVRCTKPVSLVPPVYYADLVAYRGRMFQEAAMEIRFASPNSSFSGETSTSSSTALFDKSFYDLHSDLKNMMFFV